MIKKTIILLVLYFFCRFTLLFCGEKNILANLTNSQEPEQGVFGSLEPEPLKKKTGAGAGADWEKNQEPEPDPEKNLPAPQPCYVQCMYTDNRRNRCSLVYVTYTRLQNVPK